MQQKNIILNSLKESFISIWKNKLLFASLFALQIIFLAVFAIVNYNYQTRIIESSNAIFEYLGKQQLDEASISENLLQQKGILGDDPLMISRNFNEIIKNFRIYAAWIFALLAVFSSFFWALTNKFYKNINLKQLSTVFFRNLAVLLSYLGIIFLFFFSLLSISITQLTTEASKLFFKYLVFLAVSAILSYFMFVSLSLANRTGLKNIVQKTLFVGIKKAHYVLAAYSINIILFGILIVLAYYSLEISQLILFASLAMLISSFIFGRIFIVNVVGKLD